MTRDRSKPDLDRELLDLPSELRWREWMRRIEAVLFASASPVPRDDLARVVGQEASVDLLVEDLVADLDGRSFEVARVKDGWMFRTRTAYAPAIRAAADVGDQLLDLSEFDTAVLAAIAYHQPAFCRKVRPQFKDIPVSVRLRSQRRELGEWAESGHELTLPDHVCDLDTLQGR